MFCPPGQSKGLPFSQKGKKIFKWGLKIFAFPRSQSFRYQTNIKLIIYLMAKFGIFLTMVGSVLGCGFFSGKEIAVFFTRFGAWSYLGVALSFFLFFFIFRFLLSIGSSVTSKMRTSKALLAINLSICIIFSSAMFGCLQEVTGQAVSKFVFLMLVVALCALILKKGFSAFDRLNQFLVPLMIFAFLLLLCFNVDFSIPQTDSALPFPSIFYSILYCALNSANSAVVIASLGQTLEKKDKTRVAFFSALVLALILFFANFILLQNQDSLSSSMPFLTLISSWQSSILKIVIALGALTTLFCLTYNFHITLKGKSYAFCFVLSILLPLLLSFLGYGFIVSYLEPTASVLSIMLILSFALSKSGGKIS